MKDKFTWTMTNGKIATAEAEYKQWMTDGIMDADGDKIQGDRQFCESGNIDFYIDGKRMDSTRFYKDNIKRGFESCGIFSEMNVKGLKLFKCGSSKFLLKREVAEEFLTVLKNLVKAAEIPECKETERKKIQYAIAKAKYDIEACEAQGHLPTMAQEKARRARENDLYNEGGEGFVLKLHTQEEYEYAKEELAKLEKDLKELEEE